MDAGKTGALIAAARKEKGLTQKMIAETLHVSVQAVSKWEQGLNFPDITLIEPLGELLELTVAELMAGSRNAPPEEEILHSALQLGARQLKRQTKRWRWILLLMLLPLLLAGLWFLQRYTELFPQRETVLTPLEVSEEAKWWAGPMLDGTLLLYDVQLADDFTGYTVWMELWTEEGMEQNWQLAGVDGGAPGGWGRHQKLGLQLCPRRGELSGEMESRIMFLIGTSVRPVEEIPYLAADRGLGMKVVEERITVDREQGAILCWYIIMPENAGSWNGPSWSGETAEPVVREGEAYLVVRLLCDYE